MRLALISDIHANLPALQAFMQWLNANPDITLVLNAGDLVNAGAYPREVSEIVLSDKRFINVIGNNEEALRDLGDDSQANRHRRWTSHRLGPDLLSQLTSLPHARTLEVCGRRIDLLHSRPASTSDWPLLYQRRSLREFSADYADQEPDIVVFGHTHEPLFLRFEGRTFINPGAVGVGKEATTCFSLLTLSEPGEPAGLEVEVKTLTWDRDAYAREFVQRNVPDREFILRHYFGIQGFSED